MELVSFSLTTTRTFSPGGRRWCSWLGLKKNIMMLLTGITLGKQNVAVSEWGCSSEITSQVFELYKAFSRTVLGKSACDNPERYCRWFWVHCSSTKFERMARKAMDVCLRVLKESNKCRLHNCSVRNRVLIISHIAFQDCRELILSDNLSRNSCIRTSA